MVLRPQIKHYEKNLRHILPSTDTGDSVVLNNQFSEWQTQIEENIIGVVGPGKRRYSNFKDMMLLEVCEKHSKKYSKGINGKDVIMLTHPLYLHLSMAQYVQENVVKRDSDEYVHNLIRLFYTNVDRDKTGMLLLDTVYHYAAATSLLVEEGLVDEVMFTENHSGRLLYSDDINIHTNKNFYVGGGYNEHCLSASIDEIMGVTNPMNILAIDELCLNSPADNNTTLKPYHVYISPTLARKAKKISLDDVIKKFS